MSHPLREVASGPGSAPADERRRMEWALRESEARLRAVVDATPIILWSVDADGVFTSSEGRGLRVLGLAAGDVVGRSVDEVYAGVPDVLRDVRRALAGEEFTADAPVAGKIFETRYTPLRDETGAVRGATGVSLDVTERRRAEAALREAERRAQEALEHRVAERTAELAATNVALEEEIGERQRAEAELREKSCELEAVFRALPDLYFRLDADGRVLDYQAGQRMGLFAPPEEFLGRRVQDVLPPDVGASIGEAVARVHATGEDQSVEYSLPLPAPLGMRDFEARLLPLAPAQVVAVVRDVTERNQALAAVQKSEEHFRRLIENSTEVVTILGPDGLNRYQSPSAERVLGHTSASMTGTSAFERIHPDDAEACREAIRWMLAHPGQTRSVEFRYRHGDGSWRVLEARGRTLLPDSAAEGIVVNSRDITARHESERALQLAKAEAEQAREAAEAANRAKSEFLSRMSHELRTPMNSILGFAQLLAKKDLPADQGRAVDHILKAGRHLLNLINEVLDIARIEANRQQLSLEPVRVSAVLQEALSLIRPLAQQRGCELGDVAAACDPFVRADRQRLMQVLLNLLSNAIKYNRPAGRVSVACALVAAEPGRPRRLRISVQDTGPGIAPERLGELFVPFARLGAESSAVEGTGLGLALSQRLVEAMGGTIAVDTTPGEGSTFHIELEVVASPLERLTGAHAAPARPDAARVEAPATLLYVEDNLANLTLIETILAARSHCTLVPALQGQLGLDLAWEHRPDLILLDLHLPDLPGDEVLRRLRADPRTRETPVVVISADATNRRIEQLRAAGADGYLTKPLDIDQFLETVDAILAHRRSDA